MRELAEVLGDDAVADILRAFAEDAARSPAEPHVLLIDEINRGNLPRIFGELLYLLEYRGQSVALPYSKRSFRLPANLYLIGTMNAADRSVALVDGKLLVDCYLFDFDGTILGQALAGSRTEPGGEPAKNAP